MSCDAPIEAMTFDVFGTVVDWRGGIAALGRRVAAAHDPPPPVDWGRFAEAWMHVYGAAVASLRGGWAPLGELLAAAFYRLAPSHGLDALRPWEARHLAHAWARLPSWPDAVSGFARLRGRDTLAALTNADAALLEDLAGGSGLPWDRLCPPRSPAARSRTRTSTGPRRPGSACRRGGS